MHFLIAHLSLSFTCALTAAMLWVIWRDAAEYTISNHLNAFVLALFIVGLFVLPIAAMHAVTVAAIVFAVGLVLFNLGLMGGGDVKLIAVLSLWAGWPGTGKLLIVTALLGGLLALVLVPLRRIIPPLWLKRAPTKNLPRILTRQQPIPYGIAIAGAFLYMLWTGDIPALAT